MTLRGKGLAITCGAISVASLLTTLFMSRHAGEMMGATPEGRSLLSAGAMVVDVAVPLSGLAGTALLLLKGWKPKVLGSVFLAMLAGLVVLAMGSISNFVSAERMSVEKAAQERQRMAERRQSAEEARQQAALKAQQDVATTQLGYMRLQMQDAKGRERKTLTKDFASGAAKIIGEIGKAPGSPSAPSAPEDDKVAIRSEAGPELIAEISGYSQQAITVAQIGGIAMALIMIEALFSMGAGLLWASSEEERHQELLAPAPRAEILAHPPLMLEKSEVAFADLSPPERPAEQPPAQPAASVPEPAPAAAAPPPAPEPIKRTPLPGSIPSLQAIDFPLSGEPERFRHRDVPKDAARRFVVWMQAMGLPGSYTSDEITQLYREFGEADFRELLAVDLLKGALEKTSGCERQRPKINGKQGPTRYVIRPKRFKVEASAPAEQEHNQDARVVRPPAFFRELESEPVMRREWAHLARRFDRTRKQRGSRMGRRAA